MTADRPRIRFCTLLALALSAVALTASPVRIETARPPARAPADAPLAPRTLTVLRVIDPRFPAPGQRTWELAKADAEALFARLFGAVVQFRDLGEASPQSWFAARGIAIAEPKLGLRSWVLPRGPARAEFVRRIESAISGQPAASIRAYLPAGAARSDAGADLAGAVARTFEARALLALEGPGGAALGLDGATLGLATMAPWSAAIQRRDTPDLLVTNVPIMYGHHDGAALHALVRGGLIGGFASFARPGPPYGGGAMVTLYPLLSASPAVRRVGGEVLGPHAVARAAGGLMAHEMSHVMWRLPDNYSHARCLMHPPAGLDYHRYWFVAEAIEPCAECNRSARAHEFTIEARRHADARRFDRAIAGFRRAVRVDPDGAERLNEAAWFCAERGLALDEARGWAERAVALAPRASHILDTLGWLELLTGRTEAAARHLTDALAIAGRRREHGRGEIAAHLACALMAHARFADAAGALREAIVQGVRPWPLSALVPLLERVVPLVTGTQRFF